MKIAMVGDYPLPGKSVYGGVERVVFNLSHALKKIKNMEVNVITISNELIDDFTVERGEVNVYYIPRRKPSSLSYIVRELPAIKRKIKEIDPDIVHVHGPHGVIQCINEYPMVVTIHGISWKETEFYHGLKWLIKPILHKYVLRKVKHLILINPYVETEVKKITKAKQYLIENPVEDRFFCIKNEEVEGKIFYLGVIAPRKDPLTLIKAIQLVKKQIPQVELNIGGKTTDGKYYQKILEFIKKKNLSTTVKFIGELTDEEIVREYAGCSIFCLPSCQETSPVSIAEAMAAGKPVIATRVGGIPWMIEEEKNGFLINPQDFKGLAKRIITLLSNERIREKMGESARETAKRRWRSSEIAKKTLHLYEKIIKNLG